jgi:hypothetical protein
MNKNYELTTDVEVLDKPDTLEELALQIRTASADAQRYANEATQGALIAGRLLIEAKSQVLHGEWENWVAVNCDVAPRTARAYMQLSKKLDSLDSQSRLRVADLPFREAIKAITTDPAPPPRPKFNNIRAAKRTDAQRAASIFSKAELALKSSKKRFESGLTVKGQQVADLRKKLNAVLAELDALDTTTEGANHG